MDGYTDLDMREYAKRASKEIDLLEYNEQGLIEHCFTKEATEKQSNRLEIIIFSALSAIYNFWRIYDFHEADFDWISNIIKNDILSNIDDSIFFNAHEKEVWINFNKSIFDPIDRFFKK